MDKKRIAQLQNNGWDLPLVARTQPQGNLIEGPQYLQEGDGYVACLRIYKYPSRGLQSFWGINLTNNVDTMAVMDFGTEDRNEIVEALSKSAAERSSQISGKAKASENVEASNALQNQINLLNEIETGQQTMKRFYFRIFVYAPTKAALEKRVNDIVRNNPQFGMARYVGEQYNEFASIWVPTMKEQGEMFNHPVGTPISSYPLGTSYPFNHVTLNDPRGSFYGYTDTRGPVEFDPFQRDEKRTTSFYFAGGKPGMGKSTLLKKLIDDVFARGAYIRTFDASNEYEQVTKGQNGIIVALDKPEYMINPFEIFATAINPDGTVDEYNSFDQNKERLKNFFRCFNQEATSDDLGLLDQWLTDFYIEQNLWVKNARNQGIQIHITGREHNRYPTLKEFNLFVSQQKRKMERDPRVHLTSIMATSMNRIQQTFNRLLETKGDILDGPTRFPDLSQEQVVTFLISGLLDQGDDVFNAQMYSVLSLLSADIIRNGFEQRRLLNEGKINQNTVKWYYLTLDEVENIITPDFDFGVKFLASMMEQMRKNMCAITMAAPTIKDLVKNIDSNSQYVQNVQKIFSLFQIKFFFQVDNFDIPSLATALGGSTTEEELQHLTRLERGHVFMNISGDRNLEFTVYLTDEEKQRYQGGI
ncbi:conjugal transfer protein [Limosilactobacillus gastricus]|uniref:conjugal transfer protein n=1 Tax=Limosilactobacillus gastricus TaxID=227942 RepID=UPI0026F31A6F|nr:conjugal transfer protein [Limosilactobacillus gastricus]